MNQCERKRERDSETNRRTAIMMK